MVMVLSNGMKEMLVPIDHAGRIVLPKAIRDELAINPGDFLQVFIDGNGVIMRPKEQKSGLVRKGKALVFSSGTDQVLTRETVDGVLAEERGAGAFHVSRGLPKRKK
jgi:AbrB family looped-hinge helix DNA binding protein